MCIRTLTDTLEVKLLQQLDGNFTGYCGDNTAVPVSHLTNPNSSLLVGCVGYYFVFLFVIFMTIENHVELQ